MSLIDFDDPNLVALREIYTASLPDKLAELEGIWNALNTQGWPSAERKRLQTRTHTLTSSAGSYGFPDLSAAARSIELLIKPVAAEDTLPPAHLVEQLGMAMDLIRQAVAAATAPTAAAPPAPAPTRKAKILIIDDDPDITQLMTALLERHGMEVHHCADANQAVNRATELRPDLILLDVTMPGMDGYQVCYRLQNQRATYLTPVVFVTAHSDPQDKVKALAVGGSDFLVKPVDERLLIATVERCLDRQEQWQTLPMEEGGSTAAAAPPPPAELQPTSPFRLDFGKFRDFLASRESLSQEDTSRLHSFTWDQLEEMTEFLRLSSRRMASLIGEYAGIPAVEAPEPHQLQLGVFPSTFSRRHGVVALQGIGATTDLAISNPFDWTMMDAIGKMLASRPGRLVIVPADALRALVDYTGSDAAQTGGTTGASAQDGPTATGSIIPLVHELIETAYAQGASDIHIEPNEEDVLVRYRIDGRLRIARRLQPASLIQPIVARIKVMSRLDISERRLPQDGRIAYREYNEKAGFDLRVATSPMQFGEKIVMRIIDRQKSVRPLHELGFTERNLERYRQTLKTPNGMVLHVGPTGSGKSMTLYSALNEIRSPEINIQTVEDPVEYTLPQISQLQVKPEIGLTFARALRSYLRQDPDVILVGEIRDKETASIAMEAALTGHLLLSTMHTNDAASTVTRFIEMGIEPYLISATVRMICAQRLLRLLCPECKQPHVLSEAERRIVGADQAYRAGDGCDHCRGVGYKGRVAIHELLIPDERLRMTIASPDVTTEAVRRQAIDECGMTTLFGEAMAKVRDGLCALEDVLTQVVFEGR